MSDRLQCGVVAAFAWLVIALNAADGYLFRSFGDGVVSLLFIAIAMVLTLAAFTPVDTLDSPPQ